MFGGALQKRKQIWYGCWRIVKEWMKIEKVDQKKAGIKIFKRVRI